MTRRTNLSDFIKTAASRPRAPRSPRAAGRSRKR